MQLDILLNIHPAIFNKKIYSRPKLDDEKLLICLDLDIYDFKDCDDADDGFQKEKRLKSFKNIIEYASF